MPPSGRRTRWSLVAIGLIGSLVAIAKWPWGDGNRPRERRHAAAEDVGDPDDDWAHDGPAGDVTPGRRERPATKGEGVSVEVPVRVVDRDGRPVPGASVEVRAEPTVYADAARGGGRHGDDWGGDDDDDHRSIAGAAAGADDWGGDDVVRPTEGGGFTRLLERTTVAQATTGGDGIARVPVFADVAVVFFASDEEGRRGTSSERRFDGERDPDPVRIEIDAIAILRGRVTDARGNPVSRARVEVWALTEVELDDDSSDEAAVALTGEDGRYRFELPASGAFDMAVVRDGFQDGSASAVQALAGSEAIRDFTLLDAEVIAGTVLDPRGDPAPDVNVFAARTGQTFSDEDDDWSDVGDKSTRTDDDGRFRFPDLAPGIYIIGAEPDEGRPAEVFDVRTGVTDLVVRLVEGGRIRGTVSVRDPAAHGARQVRVGSDDDDDDHREDDDDEEDDEVDGRRAKAAYVWSGRAMLLPAAERQPVASGVPRGRESESPSGMLRGRGDRVTHFRLDANGNGTFTTKPIASGTYEILVHVGQALGQRRVTVTEGGVASVSFSLPETTASGLEGTVRSAAGKPFLQCVVRAERDDEARLVRAGDDGRFLFSWLPPGAYLVSAQGPLEGGGWGSIEAQPVTVPMSGRAKLDLVLPTISTEEREQLRAKAREAPAGVPSRREEPGVWKPDVRIRRADYDDEAAGWIVVSAAASTPRLVGGDRIVEIDGASPGPGNDPQDLLYGEKDTPCRIRARRPSTGETIDVVLPRVVNREDDPDDGW